SPWRGAVLDPEPGSGLAGGAERGGRARGAHGFTRLPPTPADFFRQRVRIEMGKVQCAAESPGLARRAAPQPGLRAALAALGPADVARLGAYLALRETAHFVAWRRYRAGRTADVWRQASTTTRWVAV